MQSYVQFKSFVSRKSLPNYSTIMTFQELSDLPIQSIASDNCLLFLWASGAVFMDIDQRLELHGDLTFQRLDLSGTNKYLYQPIIQSRNVSFALFSKKVTYQSRGKRNIRQFLSCKKRRAQCQAFTDTTSDNRDVPNAKQD